MAQNRLNKAFQSNKCLSSVVEVKTKSAAEVAFEKALPYKSYVICQEQAEKFQVILKSIGKMWSYLALRKSV